MLDSKRLLFQLSTLLRESSIFIIVVRVTAMITGLAFSNDPLLLGSRCLLAFRERPVDAVPPVDLTAGNYALCTMDVRFMPYSTRCAWLHHKYLDSCVLPITSRLCLSLIVCIASDRSHLRSGQQRVAILFFDRSFPSRYHTSLAVWLRVSASRTPFGFALERM